ncbi:MAG: HAD hydrolase-like protein [Fibrobacteres bacterium]|nr:HAD hydrolase-like protein [Fibrobacterota bacterium]
MKIVMFDIDGTLIESTDFDTTLYIQSVRDVLGDVFIKEGWEQYKNVTDTGILLEIASDNGIKYDDIWLKKVQAKFYDYIASHIKTNGCKPIKGAVQLIESLSKDANYKVGFATGGWRNTAELKLRTAGFDISKIPIVTSSEHFSRTTIMQMCKNAIPGEFEEVIYFGDGIWDMKASKELSWKFVGIGSKFQSQNVPWILDYTDTKITNKELL